MIIFNLFLFIKLFLRKPTVFDIKFINFIERCFENMFRWKESLTGMLFGPSFVWGLLWVFNWYFFQMEVSSLEFLKSVKGSSRGRHLAGLTGPAIFRSEPGFSLGWSTKATKSNDWKLRTNVFWSIFGKLYLSWIDPEISTRVFAKNLSILINY